MELRRPSLDFQFLGYAVLALAAVSAVIARDLRPSDHGLEYQVNSLPAAQSNQAQEMRSFFGDTPPMQLPEAKNITEFPPGRVPGRDHVRGVLLLASAVCGLTGVVLLLISCLIFILRLRNKNRPELPPSTSAPEGKVVDN